MELPELMTVKEVAQYLRVSHRHVYETLIGKGEVEYIRTSKANGHYRIYSSSLPRKETKSPAKPRRSTDSDYQRACLAAAAAGLGRPGLREDL